VWDNSADLNKFMSLASERYVPDEGHFTRGTSVNEAIGRI